MIPLINCILAALTVEDVMSIYNKEKPLGIIVQFGGQTPLNIPAELEKRGAKILGTSPAVIDMAEDRDLFNEMMHKLEIPMPESGMAVNVEEALEIAHRIGYPIMVRPSYVLGGRGMEVVYDDNMLRNYMVPAIDVTPRNARFSWTNSCRMPWNVKQTQFLMVPMRLFLLLSSTLSRPVFIPVTLPV